MRNRRNSPGNDPQSPAEVLFGAYHRRDSGVAAAATRAEFHVREIARLAEVSAGSLHRELKLLAESGLLLREPAGNQVRYRANRDCPVFSELAGFFRKTTGLADVHVRRWHRWQATSIRRSLFGSVAQGKERITSDVHVLLSDRCRSLTS